MDLSIWKERIKISPISSFAWKLYEYYENGVVLAHQLFLPLRPRAINKYLESTQEPKLQIGAGLYPIQGFLNSDLIPRNRDIIYLDARAKYPFENNVFRYIFSEHVIEHINYADGKNMLEECFRILQPDGVLRIATPNMQFLIDLYTSDKTDTQLEYIKWSTNKFLGQDVPHMDTFVINNFFRDWGHKFIYDWKTLEKTLSDIGFTNIKRCDVGISTHSALNSIEKHGNMVRDDFNRLETIVVEAQKPVS